MSEESDRHGEKASPVGAGGNDIGAGGQNVSRVLLTPQQVESSSAEALRTAWSNQDSYIDHLESLNKQLEGIYNSYLGLVVPCGRPEFDHGTSRCFCANIFVYSYIDNTLTKLPNSVIMT